MPQKASGGPREPPNPGSSAATSSGSAGGGPDTARTKVICRRLPPTLPEAVFWSSVEPWISDADVDWKSYKAGRSTQTGPNSKESVNSVAYIHFKRQDLVTKFAAAYNGHVFRDSKGQISRVSVEYAPFQKTPAKRQKPDALSGTIDDDPDYLAFVASLNAPAEPKAVAESVSAKAPVNKNTPLLEALRQQKKLAKEKKSNSNSKGKAPEVPANGPNVAKMTRAERRAYLKHLKKEEMAAASNDSKGKTAESSGAGKKKQGLRIKGPETGTPGAPGPSVSKEAGKPVQPKQQSNTSSVKTSTHKPAQKPAEEPKSIPKMTILAPPKPSSASDVKAAAGSKQEGIKSPGTTSPPAKTKPLGNFDDIVGQFAKQMSFGGKPAQTAASAPSAPKKDSKDTKEDAISINGVNSKEATSASTLAGRGRGGPVSRGGRGSDVSRGRGQSRGSAIKGAHPGGHATADQARIAQGVEANNEGITQTAPSASRGRGRGTASNDRGLGIPRGGFRGGRGGPVAPSALTTQLPT